MSIDGDRPVGALVTERIARARLFDRLGIDYCCHGATPLAVACQQLGLSLAEVLAEVERGDAEPSRSDEVDFSAMSLARLADHIEATHHAFMRQELPRLRQLVRQVESVHGDRHPELHELASVFAAFREEIEAHLMKEERILFPMIRQLEAAATLPSFHCGSVNNPIRVMEHEHDSAGTAMSRMRTLTGGFQPPADACERYAALLAGLETMEQDLHRHIHKENNILFPRAATLEAGLSQPASARQAP